MITSKLDAARSIRVPTYEDYYHHDGLHYRHLWQEIGDTWTCPGCGRTKYQIMRWAKRFPKSPNSFMGWVAPLHRHHDHSVGYFERGQPRFPQTTICDQCNASDGAVKRKLKLPSNFSFSPQEIALFVLATPHGKHVINFDVALSIYNGLASNSAFTRDLPTVSVNVLTSLKD